MPGEASRPPPAELPGRPPPSCPSGGGGRGVTARGQAGPPAPGDNVATSPPAHPLPLSQEPPPPSPGPPGMRHTPPHAWRQGDTPLPQRAAPAARPAGASGRPRPGASCGLSSHDRPEPRATIWPGAPAGQSARPGPGPAPARPWPPAASPFASPPAPLPAPGQARPAPAQPPTRPRVSLTPRSRRGSAVAGWAPCCARCRRLPWRGRCAGRRQRRAGGHGAPSRDSRPVSWSRARPLGRR